MMNDTKDSPDHRAQEPEKRWELPADCQEKSSQASHGKRREGSQESSISGRPSSEDDDDAALVARHDAPPATDKTPVTWKSLPRKGQLVILTFARFSEPLAQSSLMAYMFYQLKSFDLSLSDSTISSQAGVLQASFSAAQVVTSVLWGRAADRIGRKTVIIIGLCGTCLSCVAFGFSRTFTQAVIFRILGGALNGNVGVMRTMISEIIREKKYQSRAFLLLPTFLNIGAILGPILGGLLADPVNTLTSIFGPGSLIGGKNGVSWMRDWPYALPNLLSATVLAIAVIGVVLGLEETHETLKFRPDRGRQLGDYVATMLRCGKSPHKYAHVPDDDLGLPNSTNLESPFHQNDQDHACTDSVPELKPIKPPVRRVWTSKVILSLLTHFFLIFNISTFNALIFTFLPTPRSSNQDHGFFNFTGGLGLSAPRVGLATAIIGIIGFPLQLILYPWLSTRFGTLKCYRLFLPCSAIACGLIPFLVLIPGEWLVWPALTGVLVLEVLARTLALPGSIILINNSCPHSSVLGTIHGVGQSVASAAKTIGPVLGGWGLGLGLQHNLVGGVWWALAIVALLGWGVAFFITEGGAGRDEEDQ